MLDLISMFSRIPQEFGMERSEAEYRFIERLTFSSATEIVAFLDEMNARDFLAVPVWLRNLAFRLAYMQEPDNSELLRKAAADLECFGPDWDDIAADLRRRAEALENAS
jgi:hypothetical protein